MYILKNAVMSITRNKGRNILIGIIILVISCATAVTLAIHNSANALIDSYKNQYEVEATLGMNRQNMMLDFDRENRDESKENMEDIFKSATSINVSDIENYADSSYVKRYYYTMSVGVNSHELEKASGSSSQVGPFGNMEGRGKDDFFNQSSGDFSLIGYSSYDAMSDFISGKYKIIEGEVSTDFSSNNCIINSELATLNNISVGDTIQVVDSVDTEKVYSLVVSGIYEEEVNNDNAMSLFSNSVNTIITNANFVESMMLANNELNVTITPTFVLTSAEVVDGFQNELYSKGLDENLSVNTNLEKVESATSTISNVSTFAVTFLVITLVIGTIVLLVVNMINIRERKYEIGVLRTIGMKKSKVAFQFMSELIMVSFVALLLGAGIGSCISVPISNHLLATEIEASRNENSNVRNNFGGVQGGGPIDQKFNGIVDVQAITSIDAVVDIKVLVELLGIGLLITLISGTSAMVSIERFSPLTILKERS